ncbi:hypothetical protein TWF173_010182 [Orbilia oligospora]|nr:hypothetical protein TWF173_010182 [Orbilia oligospora]
MGMLDIGWTPSTSTKSQMVDVIQEGNTQENGIMQANEQVPMEQTRERRATQLDHYALIKLDAPEKKIEQEKESGMEEVSIDEADYLENEDDDDTPESKDVAEERFLLRFTNGHRFAWMPWTGIWVTLMTGTEKAMIGMDNLEEPVFIQDKNKNIRIEGAESWDNFVCRDPLSDESGAETQSESQGGPPPPVWWQLTSLQRTVWKSMKVARLSSPPIACIPILISLQPTNALPPQTNGLTAAATDIIQHEVVNIEEDEEAASDYTFGQQFDGLSAGDYISEAPFQFVIEESEPLASEGLLGAQSNFYSHGGTAAALLDIEDDSGSDDRDLDYYSYAPYQPSDASKRHSEQVDNSQSGETMPLLEFPESPAQGVLNRANSMAALDLGQQGLSQTLPMLAGRYYSTGDLGNKPNGGLLQALASKSEEMLEAAPIGAPMKLMPTKSDDIPRD